MIANVNFAALIALSYVFLNIKVNYQIVNRRPGDVEAVYADTSLSEKELNWKAELGLDDMTLSAWNWEKKLRDLD